MPRLEFVWWGMQCAAPPPHLRHIAILRLVYLFSMYLQELKELNFELFGAFR